MWRNTGVVWVHYPIDIFRCDKIFELFLACGKIVLHAFTGITACVFMGKRLRALAIIKAVFL